MGLNETREYAHSKKHKQQAVILHVAYTNTYDCQDPETSLQFFYYSGPI